jgi:tRNA pseudouridine55 synthase
MDKILVVNKPKDCTSRDVINKLNKIFNEKKMGHTGTLDPFATGVLVVCMGKYTKLVDLLTNLDKEYVGIIKLGIKTDTLDITGNILEKRECKTTKENVNKVFKSFIGTYMQEVPKYSAVKIDGKKLYEYARNNESIELPKRKVSIYSLDLLNFTNDEITFKTKVSKGTYIRSLAQDICDSLNIIGTLSSLERTKQGVFTINNSYTLEDISNNNYKLLDVTDILKYPIIKVNDDNRNLFINGNKVNLDLKDNKYYIYDDNKLIAIYEFINKEGRQLIKF